MCLCKISNKFQLKVVKTVKHSNPLTGFFFQICNTFQLRVAVRRVPRQANFDTFDVKTCYEIELILVF